MDGISSRKRKAEHNLGPAAKRQAKEGKENDDLVAQPPPGSIAATDPSVCQQLKGMRIFTPRYLFRGWHAESGGNHRLNTVDAITPLAFLYASDCPPLWQLPRRQIVRNIRSHVDGLSGFGTYFSSWSQSLETAMEFGPANRPSSHICILDTHALPDWNVVMYVPKLEHILDANIRPYEREFLIYGTVTASTFTAVARKDLPNLAKLRDHGDGGLDTRISIALEHSRRFGKRFRLPMMVHMLNMIPQDPTPLGDMVQAIVQAISPRIRSSRCMLDHGDLEDTSDVYLGDAPRSKAAIELLNLLIPKLWHEHAHSLYTQFQSRHTEYLTLYSQYQEVQDRLAAMDTTEKSRAEKRRLFTLVKNWKDHMARFADCLTTG